MFKCERGAGRSRLRAARPRFGRGLRQVWGCLHVGRQVNRAVRGHLLGSRRADVLWSYCRLDIGEDMVEFSIFVQNGQGWRPPCFPCGVILVQTPIPGVAAVTWSVRLVVVGLGEVLVCV